MLLNDEELELQELEGGPNPLRCSDRFAANGVHGWSLYKDVLALLASAHLDHHSYRLNVTMIKYLEELMGSILFCRVACGINLASLAELPLHVEILVSAITQINEPDSFYLRALQERDFDEFRRKLKDSKQELVLSVFHASEGSTEYIYSTIINSRMRFEAVLCLSAMIGCSLMLMKNLRKGSRFSHATVAWHEFKFLCLEATEQYSTLYWLGRRQNYFREVFETCSFSC
nr:serine/threonine-protein kinase atm [Quercus suber]